jgi:hypothetical protein
MPQSAERRQSAAPIVLRGNVATRLVNLSRLYLGDRVDDFLPFAREKVRALSAHRRHFTQNFPDPSTLPEPI